MPSFWDKLPRPFFTLAPLADVTDAAFRRVIATYGKPDVMWTEFVSADGLCSPGREVLKRDLVFTDTERPIVAQLFGSHEDKMECAARLCMELGFDGIDINMGCPDRSIEKQGAGAAMIKTPEQAKKIIEAARRGAPGLPISVKTRVGYNNVAVDEWIPELLGCDLAALTIHARTRKEMSAVPARWEHVREAVELRDKMGVSTLVIGNGDVKDMEDARVKARETGCDGVMLGRAIFGNPWLFASLHDSGHGSVQEFSQVLGSPLPQSGIGQTIQKSLNRSVPERLRVMAEHTKLFEELLGDIKSFAIMKKHYKAYVNDFDAAKELRTKLMEAQNAKEVEVLVEEFLSHE